MDATELSAKARLPIVSMPSGRTTSSRDMFPSNASALISVRFSGRTSVPTAIPAAANTHKKAASRKMEIHCFAFIICSSPSVMLVD